MYIVLYLLCISSALLLYEGLYYEHLTGDTGTDHNFYLADNLIDKLPMFLYHNNWSSTC